MSTEPRIAIGEKWATGILIYKRGRGQHPICKYACANGYISTCWWAIPTLQIDKVPYTANIRVFFWGIRIVLILAPVSVLL